MACVAALMHENIWVDRFRVQDAEISYHQALANQRAGLVVTSATNHAGGGENAGSDLINEIVRARQNIKNTLSNDGVGLKVGMGVDNPEVQARLNAVEHENRELKKVTAALQETVAQLTARVMALEKATGTSAPAPTQAKAAPPADDDDDDDDDDDVDLFGEETEEEQAAAEARKKAREEEAKKKKPKKVIIAKSSIILDVKPWDDETDMKEMEKKVREIEADGLVWGGAKLVPVGYGIKKLQIICVVEDDKVGVDFLEEKITDYEDLVQSVDIVAFNKI